MAWCPAIWLLVVSLLAIFSIAHRCKQPHETDFYHAGDEYSDKSRPPSADCLTGYHCPQQPMCWFEAPRTYLPVLYVSLFGGLGNQMFQMASVYGMAKRAHMNVIAVVEDHCHCPLQRTRPYLYYQQFDQPLFLDIPYVSRICITYRKKLVEPKWAEYHYLSNIQERMPDSFWKTEFLMFGYFQHVQYFVEYRDELRAMFLRPSIVQKLSIQFPHVHHSYFLHVRRGDYLNDTQYWMNSDVYYTTATELILTQDPEAHFYIFSDDFDYCRNSPILQRLPSRTFINNLNDIESLYLMIMCRKGGICANSTFSWWAAFLNSNPFKLIVMPRRWINDDSWSTTDLFSAFHYDNNIIAINII